MTESEFAQAITDGVRVDFEAPAKLYQFPAGTFGYVRGAATYAGSLGETVKRFMALTPAEVAGASIGIDLHVIEGCTNGLLTPKVIWAIAGRDDCPR